MSVYLTLCGVHTTVDEFAQTSVTLVKLLLI